MKAFISTMPKRKSVEFDNDDDDEDDFLAEDDYFEDSAVFWPGAVLSSRPDEGEARLLSDPYAGIFFSKDRVERVHEAVEEVRKVPLPTEKGHLKQLPLLSRSEWMSGCPEEGACLLSIHYVPLLMMEASRVTSSSSILFWKIRRAAQVAVDTFLVRKPQYSSGFT